jgi:hypothetical protein
MSFIEIANHLLNFAAPALVVGLLTALAGRWVGRAARQQRWWLPVLFNSAAGLAALLAGLWFFGHDGKMASYGALVLACATSQWLTARAWRG